MKKKFSLNLRTLLASAWLVFTLSLATWWWIFVLGKIMQQSDVITPSMYSMILMEGTSLVLSILIGGGFLVWFAYRDQKRHQKLTLFFSNFSHDIKTSIARLRLQAEVLAEEKESQSNPMFARLITDISRLELQLENSLFLSNLENSGFKFNNIKMSEILRTLRGDFSELQVNLNQDIEFVADQRALLSIFRNLFSNSIIHGKSEKISIHCQNSGEYVEINVKDNGQGYSGNIADLGNGLLSSKHPHGNGLGLHLCRQLIQRMNGQLQLHSDSGFSVQILLPRKGGTHL